MEEEYTGLLTAQDLVKRREKIRENEKRNNMYRVFLVPDREALRKKIATLYKEEKKLKKSRKILVLDEIPNRFLKK
jgi:hypothetical protein